MLDNLVLQTKIDVPFEEAQLIFHQPTIYEIALVGQSTFLTGCEYLAFSKDNLKIQDKLRLEEFTNFEVLMSIMKEDNIAIKKIQVCMKIVLSLMLPEFNTVFTPSSIILTRKVDDQVERHLIDKENFEKFRNIVLQMFCLKQLHGGRKYNPKGSQAAALVKKFEQRQAILARQKKKDKDTSGIFDRYISVLAVGLSKDKNQLAQYTIPQLFDEFRRFKAKEGYDIWIDAKMAGAKNLDEIDNWMGDLSPDT